MFLDGVEKGGGLEPVAGRPGTGFLDHATLVDGILHVRDDESDAELDNPAVAVLEHLGEVVTGVDVEHRKRDPGRREGLLGQPEHHDRVLAAGEQQGRVLELGRDLTHDVDRLGFEFTQMGELVGHDASCCPLPREFMCLIGRPMTTLSDGWRRRGPFDRAHPDRMSLRWELPCPM